MRSASTLSRLTCLRHEQGIAGRKAWALSTERRDRALSDQSLSDRE